MNKLRPGTISRADPRDDGFIRTSNVTKFLASCSAQGIPFEDLFHRDDLIESTPESLARVARTIICVVNALGSSVVDRSSILSGQGKKTIGASETSSGPYGYGTTSSRAASSVPNLSATQLQYASLTPKSRKRWTPPSPIPTVRSTSSSEVDSGTNSNKTSPKPKIGDGRTTLIHDQAKDITPPALTSKSPSQAQSKTVTSGMDPSSNMPQEISRLDPVSVSIGEQSIPLSVARRSVALSDITDTTMHSSLLDHRSSNNGNKFETIRTVTTEATSFAPSDMPSYTRTEASFIATSLSDEMAKKRGTRERKPIDATIVDLSRVTEEKLENVSSLLGSEAGKIANNGIGRETSSSHKQESQERLYLGKGKWPDDFLGVLQAPNRTQPMPIKPKSPYPEGSATNPMSTSPPRKLAPIRASQRNDSLDSIPLIPRRPRHRARHSVEPVLIPKEVILRRDVSLDEISPQETRVSLRRQSTKTGVQRIGTYLPQNDFNNSSNEEAEPVPFPRTASGESSAVQSSGGAPRVDGSGNDRPRQLRGRFQSEIEGISARRRTRPNSYDDVTNKARQMRFESMINLGVGFSNANASDILSRESMDGSAVRRTLIVREEGKAPTHFVSCLTSVTSCDINRPHSNWVIVSDVDSLVRYIALLI